MGVITGNAHAQLTCADVCGMIKAMAAADPIRARNAQRLRAAMDQYGYSLRELAIEAENVRQLRGDDNVPTRETLKREISHVLATGKIGPMWREDLAAVFGVEPDEFFVVPIETQLPHPLLLQLPIDSDVLEVIRAQQHAHIRAEHAFGPQHARPLVESDLVTIESLIAHAPPQLKPQMRQGSRPKCVLSSTE